MSQALNLERTRALIVDDDSRLREILGRLLTEHGARVTSARSGAEGLVALKLARDRNEPFELVLVDAEMAGMDGFEMLGHLRHRPEEIARTVLLLAPENRIRGTLRARELKVGAFVMKPVSGADLRDAIAGVLGRGPQMPQVKSPPAPPVHADSPVRLLLAEDSEEIRKIIRYFLERPGVQIDLAENGGVALDLFRIHHYDLVLMDIQMPHFDGYSTVESIRAWEKQHGHRRTPVIAITAYPRTESAEKSLRAGFDGYLNKPINRETLVDAVRHYLKRPDLATTVPT